MTRENKVTEPVDYAARRYQRKIDQARSGIERYEKSKADIDFEISILQKQIAHYEAQVTAVQNQKEDDGDEEE